MTQRGFGRKPGVTLRNWLRRLEREGEGTVAELLPAVELYYRRRFDPGTNGDLEDLHQSIDAWLRRHAKGAQSSHWWPVSRAAQAALVSKKTPD
jgi:hypothetical protein